MSKESEQLRKLLGDDLNKIDKDRIMSRVEQTYGMRIAELTDILKEVSGIVCNIHAYGLNAYIKIRGVVNRE